MHGGPEFLLWHREIVNRLEIMLRQINPQLSLHYWDWTQDPRAVLNANLGGGAIGTLNLFTPTFMGYGGASSASIGEPWLSARYYVPGASLHRDATRNPADPPNNVVRNVSGSPASAAGDNAIVIAPNYPAMRVLLENVHNAMHGFVNMGGQHISFRDPFVFLLHSNVDRLFAKWQTQPFHLERVNPALVYGAESGDAGLNRNVEPWSGGLSIRPWASPENQGFPHNYKHLSIVIPPLYDTNGMGMPEALVNRVGDFDGDGRAEIFVTSPWGISILKQSGTTMSPLMMAPNGTRFGGWLLNTADNKFGPVADYDGDGRQEILVESPWGIGILKFSGGSLTAPMMQPNGSRFGGWLLNSADNDFGPSGDYDGDGQAEILITSPWGIGILKQAGSTMSAIMMQPNGTRFGGWLLSTTDNRFGPAADFDGDGRTEIFVKSPWGIGILKLSDSTLTAPMMQPNGTRFGGWLLNTADNNFSPSGDYDGDGRAEILVSSPWGIGILKQVGTTMAAQFMAPNGTRFGGWLLNTSDNDFGSSADYDGDGRLEIFVKSRWGIGILKLSGSALTAPMMQPNGTRLGGWLLNTMDNRFGSVGKYVGDPMGNIFVTSPWGVGILQLAGSTMTAPMMQPNGTRFGGWLLNTADNVF